MYILYSRPTRITGRILRRQLGCHGGLPVHYATQRESIRVVRWGSSMGEDTDLVLNKATAVAKAANKLESLKIMKEAGVDVPRFSISPTDFGDDAVCLGRTIFHRGGTDINVLQEYHTDAIYSDYFTEYIPAVQEFRLHMFRGELIGAQVKKFEGEGEEAEVPIRNHSNGYVFVPFMHSRPHQRRIDTAGAAIEALGLDFGAVDLLVSADDRSIVLEVNTAPGLSSDRTLEAYTEAISAWAQ